MSHAFGDMVSVEWGMPGEEINIELCNHSLWRSTTCCDNYLTLARARQLHLELGKAIAYAEKNGAKTP